MRVEHTAWLTAATDGPWLSPALSGPTTARSRMRARGAGRPSPGNGRECRPSRRLTKCLRTVPPRSASSDRFYLGCCIRPPDVLADLLLPSSSGSGRWPSVFSDPQWLEVDSVCRMYFDHGMPNGPYYDFIDFTVCASSSNVDTTRVDRYRADLRLRRHPANNPTLCAGLNRHVAQLPASEQSNPANFYQAAPVNYYAGFWHENAINSKQYGFPTTPPGSPPTSRSPTSNTWSSPLAGNWTP